jgi:5-hydroxyisourate hydrolase
VALEVLNAGEGWSQLAAAEFVLSDSQLTPGTYRLVFAIAKYFESLNQQSFYPEVTVTFLIDAAAEHYHVPLLINPFGYSTYRGS